MSLSMSLLYSQGDNLFGHECIGMCGVFGGVGGVVFVFGGEFV